MSITPSYSRRQALRQLLDQVPAERCMATPPKTKKKTPLPALHDDSASLTVFLPGLSRLAYKEAREQPG